MKRGKTLVVAVGDVDMDENDERALDSPPWSVVRRSPVPNRTISSELLASLLLSLSLADDDSDGNGDRRSVVRGRDRGCERNDQDG